MSDKNPIFNHRRCMSWWLHSSVWAKKSALVVLGICVFLFSLAARASYYDEVYTIQLAAFESEEKARLFIKTVPNLPLYCRTKTNGLEAVYYGVYPNWQFASNHIDDYDIFKSLGAYVLKLKAVNMKPCENLTERLEKLKQFQVLPQTGIDSYLKADIYP